MHNIQVQRDIRIVLIAGVGGPGHGPVLLLLESAAELFFMGFWDSWMVAPWIAQEYGCTTSTFFGLQLFRVNYARKKVFVVAPSVILVVKCRYQTRPVFGCEIKRC